VIEFWKKWKSVTLQEKDAIISLKKAKKVIFSSIPCDKIVSIYVGGSFVRREMIKDSDVDVWVITSDMHAQKLVTKMIHSYSGKDKPKIGFSGYALWELKTGKHYKEITKFRTGPKSWVKNLDNYHLVYGKKLRLEDFAIREDLDDLKFLIKQFNSRFLPFYSKGRIGFQDVLKQVFWLVDFELKLRGQHPPHSWNGIVRLAPEDHIVHEALKLRKVDPDKRTKNAFVAKLKKHLKALKVEFR